MTRIEPDEGTRNVNSPFSFVTAAVLVPLTLIVAPDSGSPLSFLTVPLTSISTSLTASILFSTCPCKPAEPIFAIEYEHAAHDKKERDIYTTFRFIFLTCHSLNKIGFLIEQYLVWLFN